MTTGQCMKEARKKAGLTQSELADKLGIPYQSVSQWERGTRNPKYATLQRIAKALDVPVAYLMGWEDAKTRLYDTGLSINDIAEELDIPRDALEKILNSGSFEAIEKIMIVGEMLTNEAKNKKLSIVDNVRSKLKASKTPLDRINVAVNQMTEEGQEKVADYAEDILPRYRVETTPQSPPVPQGDKDTPTKE